MGQSGTFIFTHLRLHYHQEKIRIGDLQNDLKKKISPPGLDGSMKKMPHLSKWSNEFAGYDHYTFFFSIHKMSHLGQPTVPIHYFPNLLTGTLWSCPTVISTSISWDKASKSTKCQVSLSFMIPAGKQRHRLSFPWKSTATIFPKSICSPQPPKSKC